MELKSKSLKIKPEVLYLVYFFSAGMHWQHGNLQQLHRSFEKLIKIKEKYLKKYLAGEINLENSQSSEEEKQL